MNNITLQDLLDKLKEYNPEEVEIVKAYLLKAKFYEMRQPKLKKG